MGRQRSNKNHETSSRAQSAQCTQSWWAVQMRTAKLNHSILTVEGLIPRTLEIPYLLSTISCGELDALC